MTIEELKQFLAENRGSKEVTEVIKESLNAEIVSDFLDTNEGAKVIQPRLDKYHNKSLTSWKEKNLDKIVADKLDPLKTELEKEIKKANGIATNPLEERLAKLESDLKASKRENEMLNLKKKLSDKIVDPALMDYLNLSDPESAEDKIDDFNSKINALVESKVNSALKLGSRDPETGKNSGKAHFTKEQVEAMSEKEIIDNMEKITESQSAW